MKNIEKIFYTTIKGIMLVIVLSVFLMISIKPISAKTKVTKITWAVSKRNMYLGKPIQFKAKITPVNAVKTSLGWKTSNKKILKVNSKGIVTPLKTGKATVTCYVKSQKTKKVTCKITVKKQSVTSIAFSKEKVIVQKGQTTSNPLTVSPSYAFKKTVVYTSSNTSVATVSASGVVLGKHIGKTTITATATDGSKKKNSYQVIVITPITKNSTKFIAHRGLSTQAPENTIEAYKLAGEAGFWGAETDVRMTKDKKFILLHDPTFHRLCGIDSKPEDMTLEDIQKLTIKSGNNIKKYRNEKSATTIATLEDYLNVCKKYNMVPVIEIKMEFVEYGEDRTNSQMQIITKNNMEDLYELTSQIMGDKEYIFIAYDFETMVQMRKVLVNNATTSENVRLQHVTNNPDKGMINYYKKRRIELDVNYKKISATDIEAFKDAGVNVNLWTVDDIEKVASYITQKVDYITTNTKFW